MVVSRQAVIDSRLSSVVCTPVYSKRHGLSTQVDLGTDEGLRHDCAAHCDALMSIEKSRLTDYVGTLSAEKIHRLDHALRIALALE